MAKTEKNALERVHMNETLKHPKEFGFSEGIVADVSLDGLPSIGFVSDLARTKTPIVYVGIVDDGTVLKVGVSKNGLLSRWKGIFNVMDEQLWHRLRPNEQEDGKRLIGFAAGKKVSVWLKQPMRVKIPYAEGLVDEDYCARHAEEIFLDQYYAPLFGQRLEGRAGR